ncbi:hypothetical protein [Agromyces sp. GXS1127]|uniref:hypothetical protein n=1 Tax=Agromyces sp. GXS1127 TaxID=3424181 RepID=UPI003D31EA67
MTGAAPVLCTAAAGAYAANCALGASVALGLVDTSGFRWVHHALYLATCALSVSALAAALRPGASARSRAGIRPSGRVAAGDRTGRAAAALLAPAVVPLAVIPYAGTRGTRHPLIALAAAPFLAAAAVRSWR